MTKTEEFEHKQAAMSDKELHDLVRTELSKLCKTGGRSLTMCVPPNVTDTDMLISELLNRFKRITNFAGHDKPKTNSACSCIKDPKNGTVIKCCDNCAGRVSFKINGLSLLKSVLLGEITEVVN
jgi:hypothetical protein